MTTQQRRVPHHATAVTVLGLGPMGHALAGAFLNNGHVTTVWNRSGRKADALVARGAIRADTVAEAVTASPVAIICVLDYDTVHAILSQAGETLRGRALVNLTADSPQRAREMAAWVAEQGADYLDGAIMTPTTSIGEPSALVLYSGSQALYEAWQPTLSSVGGMATYVGGDPGRAAAYDVALLDIFWTSVSGYVHAVALAATENIAATELAPYAQGLIGLLPDIMAEFAHQNATGHYPGDKSTITSAVAGMEHIIHAARAHGIDVGVLSAAKAVAQAAIDSGYGADGFSRLIQVLSDRQQSVVGSLSGAVER